MLVINDFVLEFYVFTVPAEHPSHARVQEKDERLRGEDALPEWHETEYCLFTK